MSREQERIKKKLEQNPIVDNFSVLTGNVETKYFS